LREFNGICFIPDNIWIGPDQSFTSDACLTGGGAWSGKEYFSVKFPQFILEENNHISTLEMMVVMVAVKIWGQYFCNSRLKIFCDNEATVITINSGRVKDKRMLTLLREIAFSCAKYNMDIECIHLPGKQNTLADKLSRAHLKSDVKVEDLVDKEFTRITITDSLFFLDNDW
jgi:hypothetical protein